MQDVPSICSRKTMIMQLVLKFGGWGGGVAMTWRWRGLNRPCANVTRWLLEYATKKNPLFLGLWLVFFIDCYHVSSLWQPQMLCSAFSHATYILALLLNDELCCLEPCIMAQGEKKALFHNPAIISFFYFLCNNGLCESGGAVGKQWRQRWLPKNHQQIQDCWTSFQTGRYDNAAFLSPSLSFTYPTPTHMSPLIFRREFTGSNTELLNNLENTKAMHASISPSAAPNCLLCAVQNWQEINIKKKTPALNCSNQCKGSR